MPFSVEIDKDGIHVRVTIPPEAREELYAELSRQIASEAIDRAEAEIAAGKAGIITIPAMDEGAARTLATRNLYKAIAAKNAALADLTDENPSVALALANMAKGILSIAERRGLSPQQFSTETVVTGEDKIVTSIVRR